MNIIKKVQSVVPFPALILHAGGCAMIQFCIISDIGLLSMLAKQGILIGAQVLFFISYLLAVKNKTCLPVKPIQEPFKGYETVTSLDIPVNNNISNISANKPNNTSTVIYDNAHSLPSPNFEPLAHIPFDMSYNMPYNMPYNITQSNNMSSYHDNKRPVLTYTSTTPT